jgi:hypothetical protein
MRYKSAMYGLNNFISRAAIGLLCTLAPRGRRSTFGTLLSVAWDSYDYSAALVKIFVRFVLMGNDPPERTQAILRNFSETCNTNSPSFASTMALCQKLRCLLQQTLARVPWRLSRKIIHNDDPSALFI